MAGAATLNHKVLFLDPRYFPNMAGAATLNRKALFLIYQDSSNVARISNKHHNGVICALLLNPGLT